MSMETKFKVGDKVRVVDNGDLDAEQSCYLGKKGVITDDFTEYPTVKFKDKVEIVIYQEKLTLAKPNRHPFDLERALKGEEVVTRKGLPVDDIKVINNTTWCLEANVGDEGTGIFTGTGRYDFDGKKDEFDLFMKHPAKAKTDTEVLTELFKDVTFTVEPVKDYEKLRETFEGLLACYIGHLDKGKGIVNSWRAQAGL